MADETGNVRQPWLALAGGAVLFAVLLLLPPPAGMPAPAWAVVAVVALMSVWWVSEALPVAVTALLPLVLFPLMGVAGVAETAAPYADPVIFLFLGGLLLGLTVQKWNLHRRMAVTIVGRVGIRADRVILGFMAAAAFISMWVSNTATAALMLPVAVSVVAFVASLDGAGRDDRFARALLIGVAFAASIGGMATLIGTPPNAIFAAFMRRTYDIDIGFAEWMLVGLPLAVVFLLATWLVLVKLVFRLPARDLPGVEAGLERERASLGPMAREEMVIAAVFALAAVLWMTRPLLAGLVPGLSDAGIAIAAAVALFVLPAGDGRPLIGWDDTARLPFGVLILFGGGLALAGGIESSGLAAYLGDRFALIAGWPVLAIVGAAVVLAIVLSELASNTATAAMLLPVVAAVAAGLGLDPFAMTVPVVLAASCGFMLPIATPPNALFYASGRFTIRDLVRAGALVDLIGAVLVLFAGTGLARLVFG